MITNYDGAQVFDADGNKVGHVERTYVDNTRTSKYVEVKMGTLFAKHRLVPVDGSEIQNDGVHVPYSKADIENSPDASDFGDGIGEDTLDQVRAYYDGGTTDTATSDDVAARSVEARDSDADGDNDGEGVGDRVAGTVAAAKAKLAGDDGDVESSPRRPYTQVIPTAEQNAFVPPNNVGNVAAGNAVTYDGATVVERRAALDPSGGETYRQGSEAVSAAPAGDASTDE